MKRGSYHGWIDESIIPQTEQTFDSPKMGESAQFQYFRGDTHRFLHLFAGKSWEKRRGIRNGIPLSNLFHYAVLL